LRIIQFDELKKTLLDVLILKGYGK